MPGVTVPIRAFLQERFSFFFCLSGSPMVRVAMSL